MSPVTRDRRRAVAAPCPLRAGDRRGLRRRDAGRRRPRRRAALGRRGRARRAARLRARRRRARARALPRPRDRDGRGPAVRRVRRDGPDARRRADRLRPWRCWSRATLGADSLCSLLGPRARRRQAWVHENGFSAVLASRLAPGVPAGIVNYLAGLAGIRTRAFVAAVALGSLPKTIAYVALGGALSTRSPPAARSPSRSTPPPRSAARCWRAAWSACARCPSRPEQQFAEAWH